MKGKKKAKRRCLAFQKFQLGSDANQLGSDTNHFTFLIFQTVFGIFKIVLLIRYEMLFLCFVDNFLYGLLPLMHRTDFDIQTFESGIFVFVISKQKQVLATGYLCCHF